MTPNDPVWTQQKPRFEPVCLQGAWSRRVTSDKLIAVLDSGVKYDLPDLAPNMWRNPLEFYGQTGVDDDHNGIVDDIHGATFVSTGNVDCDPFGLPISANDPMDRCGHGTEVASVLGAAGDNGLQMAGVLWKCQILPVKIWGAPFGASSDAAHGMEYAYSKGARIMNCSWYADEDSGLLHDFIHTTGDALYVVAAGNSHLDLDAGPPYQIRNWFPALWGDDNILVVGNAGGTQGDVMAADTNWGLASVDLFAPGQDMIALGLSGAGTEIVNGTSFSAPVVSGVAALLWSAKPALTPAVLKQYLMNATDTVPAFQGMCVTGGRLNAAKALGTPCD